MDILFCCVALLAAAMLPVAIQVLLNYKAIVLMCNNFIELTKSSKAMVEHLMRHEEDIKELKKKRGKSNDS